MIALLLVENSLGKIEISEGFFVDLIGSVVAESFGVVRTFCNLNQKVKSMVKCSGSEGIIIEIKEGSLIVDLHVEVKYGVSISEVVRNLAQKAKYIIEDYTDFKVEKVNVYVDKMSN